MKVYKYVFLILFSLIYYSCDNLPTSIADDCTKNKDCIANKDRITCYNNSCVKPRENTDCSADADICKGNTNGKVICIDNICMGTTEIDRCIDDTDCLSNTNEKISCFENKCVKPIMIDDCIDDRDCMNNTNEKTSCFESKCVEPKEVSRCVDNTDCVNNTNEKIVCIENTCIEPIEVNNCSSEGDCLDNTNGKTTCFNSVCVEPIEKSSCDEDDDCLENTNGHVVCFNDYCVEPKEESDCSENSDICTYNTNGRTTCSESVCIECEISNEGVESCDNIDNDCNGLVDDGDLCADFVNGEGVCDSENKKCILIACNEFYYNNDKDDSNGCEYGACIPRNGGEICNSDDDDCDGDTDEDFDLENDPLNCNTCGTVCSSYPNAASKCENSSCKMGACDDGYYDKDLNSINGCEYACTYTSETDLCEELSDGNEYIAIDNDCDGDTDEDADLTVVENCGECGNNCNIPINSDDLWSVIVTCSGSRECEYTCKEGWNNNDGEIANGCEYYCSISNNSIEICDGLDNDCNGEADDGLTCTCNNADNEICILENTYCTGNRVCVDGSWGVCDTGDSNNGIEVCDGLDNDCNDVIDNPFKTGTVYTDDNHCGACNQKCEANHATNTCFNSGDNIGTCNLYCDYGWSDFNDDKFDGCETGCSIYKWGRLSPQSYLRIAGGESGNDTEYADSYYSNSNLAVFYRKTGATFNIYGKSVDKKGNTIINENKITSLIPEKYTSDLSVVEEGGKYFLFFRSNNDGSYDPYYMVLKGSSFSTIKSMTNVSNTNDNARNTYISKENYITEEIPIVWSEYNAGKYKTHYRTINSSTNNLNSEEEVITPNSCSTCNAYYPKVTTALNYVGLLYCVKDSTSGSSLYLERKRNNYLRKGVTLATYSSSDCDGNNTYSITSDGTYFYVSYINNNKLYVEKRSSSYLTKSYEYIKDGLLLKYISLSISYNLNNIVIAYKSSFFNLITYVSTYSLNTIRLNKSLELKNTNSSFRSSTNDFFDGNINVFYTDDEDILLQYSTNATSLGTDIEISRTNTCEN